MPHLNTIHHLPSTIHDSNAFAVYASGSQRSELLDSPVFGSRQLLFAESLEELVDMKAGAYFDLLYEDEQGWEKDYKKQNGQNRKKDNGKQEEQKGKGHKMQDEQDGKKDYEKRIASLSKLLPAPVFINSVIQPLSHIHPGFIRINGWPGFLKMPLVEAAAASPDTGKKAEEIFGNQIRLVKDMPGLVTPRIISMIINEARITLAAGTSTREEIDTAMKLGTGYPFGPFEWEERIGAERIREIVDGI
jgi:hypothetical protein